MLANVVYQGYAGGLDPSTLAIVYHLGADSRGDRIEIIRISDNAKLATEFEFFFGDDTSLGRLAVTNNAGTEIRRVDQVFTLENSTYTWSNGHGVGSAVTGKRFITDSFGNQHHIGSYLGAGCGNGTCVPCRPGHEEVDRQSGHDG